MWIFALALLAAPPAAELHAFLPCTPGLSIEYAITPHDPALKTARMIETVRGPGRELRTCVIDRKTIRADGRETTDARALEHLEDRISDAGWLDQPVAFRTPLLFAPLVAARKWRFNTTEFEIRAVGLLYDVPAGRFEGCVRVEERARDGRSHAAYSIYAPGVGLIAYGSKDEDRVATRVDRPEAQAKSRPPVKIPPHQGKSSNNSK